MSDATPSTTDNVGALRRLLTTDPQALIVADARGEVVGSLVAVDQPAALSFWSAAGFERQSDRSRFVRNL